MNLEYKRKKLELARVQMAKSELEFKVEERSIEIAKLKEHIDLQSIKENELMTELDNMKEEK